MWNHLEQLYMNSFVNKYIEAQNYMSLYKYYHDICLYSSMELTICSHKNYISLDINYGDIVGIIDVFENRLVIDCSPLKTKTNFDIQHNMSHNLFFDSYNLNEVKVDKIVKSVKSLINNKAFW